MSRSSGRLFLSYGLAVLLFVLSSGCEQPDASPVATDDGATAASGADTDADADGADVATATPAVSTGTDTDTGHAAVPSEKPGDTQPQVDDAEPVSFELPTDGDAEALTAFITKMTNLQPSGSNLDEIKASLEKQMNAIASAADALLSVESSTDQKIDALQAKEQALRALAQYNIGDAAERFSKMADELLEHEDATVVAWASQRTLEQASRDFFQSPDSTEADAVALVELAKKILASELKDKRTFDNLYNAMMNLERRGFGDKTLPLMESTISKFKDTESEEVADQVDALREITSYKNLDLQNKMQAYAETSTAESRDSLVAALQELLESETRGGISLQISRDVADLLVRNDNYESASTLYAAMHDAFKDHANPQFAEFATHVYEGSKKKLGLVGKPLPIKASQLDGTPFDWEKLKGKVVLVDFWATWCGPCLREIPHMREYLKEYGEHGFAIVGCNVDVDPDQLTKFLVAQELPWPTVIKADLDPSLDPNENRFDHPWFGEIGVSGIPFMALLDREGNVAWLDTRGEKFHEKVRAMLNLSDKPAEDKPAEDKPAEDKPADDKPADDKPAEDKPAEDKPAEDKPADDKPADDKPADDKPAGDKPTEE